MTTGILSSLIIIFLLRAGPQASAAGPPNILNVVSNATCQPEYAWMDNAEGKDPCLTVAYVIAACVGDTWTQPPLIPGESYDSPNGTTATPCYCSWSCYNLMMACTLCQNATYTASVKTWPTFVQNCPLNYKDEIFPQGYVLLSNISIPYWATINPETWPSELFETEQAEIYANKSQPDYYPGTNSSGTSSGSDNNSGSNTNIGAIIGGTISGTALLVIIVGGYFLYQRRKNRCLNSGTVATTSLHTGMHATNTHAYLPSNPSSFFSSTGSPAPTTYTTTQMGTGMSVMSGTSYSSFQATSPPPPTATETASFMTTGNNVIVKASVPSCNSMS
ncbi:hypothetical protein JVU11DRAFT_9554 [Chiua virens]|nr:hypothetical protein JVU11DRAFT_9554 [Chiua virens]